METAHPKNSGEAGSSKILSIDVDAILAVQQESDEGLTTEEWAEELNISKGKTRKLLKVGIDKGLFERGEQLRMNWNGRRHSFQVYKYIA